MVCQFVLISLGNSKQIYHKVSYKANDKNTSGDKDDEEDLESFLLEEQKAQDEMERNPLHNPIVDLMPQRTNGRFIQKINNLATSSVDSRKGMNFKSQKIPSITFRNVPTPSKQTEKMLNVPVNRNGRLKGYATTDFDDIDTEPMPLPQKVPSFLHKNETDNMKDYHIKRTVDLHHKNERIEDYRQNRLIKGEYNKYRKRLHLYR